MYNAGRVDDPIDHPPDLQKVFIYNIYTAGYVVDSLDQSPDLQIT